ncbi:hypothetical protein NX059_010597 [Plenodomus lindquistii]|nr:hypothetical protein NX059_010597 [Plenodomus lindquistii]
MDSSSRANHGSSRGGNQQAWTLMKAHLTGAHPGVNRATNSAELHSSNPHNSDPRLHVYNTRSVDAPLQFEDFLPGDFVNNPTQQPISGPTARSSLQETPLNSFASAEGTSHLIVPDLTPVGGRDNLHKYGHASSPTTETDGNLLTGLSHNAPGNPSLYLEAASDANYDPFPSPVWPGGTDVAAQHGFNDEDHNMNSNAPQADDVLGTCTKEFEWSDLSELSPAAQAPLDTDIVLMTDRELRAWFDEGHVQFGATESYTVPHMIDSNEEARKAVPSCTMTALPATVASQGDKGHQDMTQRLPQANTNLQPNLGLKVYTPASLIDESNIAIPSSDSANDRKKQPNKRLTKKDLVMRHASDFELPDPSSIQLHYSSKEEAFTDFQVRFKKLATYWTAPINDKTIPQTSNHRAQHVRVLVTCMKNIKHYRDKDIPRWELGAEKPYRDEDLELTGWKIVDLAERLHREGPCTLEIHDVHFLDKVKESEDLTFGQRLKYIAMILLEFKSRADAVIKGDSLHTIVGAPQIAYYSACSNNRHNHNKQSKINFADEHMPLSPGGTKKRKRTRLEQTPASDTAESGPSRKRARAACRKGGSSAMTPSA